MKMEGERKIKTFINLSTFKEGRFSSVCMIRSIAAGTAAESSFQFKWKKKKKRPGHNRLSRKASLAESDTSEKKATSVNRQESRPSLDQKLSNSINSGAGDEADDEGSYEATESIYSSITEMDDETIFERCLQELIAATETMSITRAKIFILQNVAVMIPYKMIDKSLIAAAYMSLSDLQRDRLTKMGLSSPISLAKTLLTSKLINQFFILVLIVAIILLCVETTPNLSINNLQVIFIIECFCMLVFVVEIVVQAVCLQKGLLTALRGFSSPTISHLYSIVEVIYSSVTIGIKTKSSEWENEHQPPHSSIPIESPVPSTQEIEYRYLDSDLDRWIWLLLDLLATTPFFVEVLIDIVIAFKNDLGYYGFLFRMYSWSESTTEVQVLRLFRVLRLFKVGQKSDKLRIIFKAISSATDGIWLLLMTLPLFVVFFSFLLFYAEHSESEFLDGKWVYSSDNSTSNYQSIYDCFWMIAQTVTTVGYGDMPPKSGLGKFVISMVMFLAFFVVAFPLCIITMEYSHYARIFSEKKRGHAEDARILRNRLMGNRVGNSSSPSSRAPSSMNSHSDAIPVAVTATEMKEEPGAIESAPETATATQVVELSSQSLVPVLEPVAVRPIDQPTPTANPILPSTAQVIASKSSVPVLESSFENLPIAIRPSEPQQPISTANSIIRSFTPPIHSLSVPDFETPLPKSESEMDDDVSRTKHHHGGIGGGHTESLHSLRPKHHHHHHHLSSTHHGSTYHGSTHHGSMHHGSSSTHGHHGHHHRSHHVSVADVDHGVSSALTDGYPNTVLFRIQDWKLEYREDKREDLLTMRIRIKDEKSYRELMRFLAEHC
ncbi:hypothetical protein BDR26DRAFT_1005504 [Obelidium mucronatum]|nr:hypothetical protein BDR26DRAFT_1005504 [Obelidium mucronatum]